LNREAQDEANKRAEIRKTNEEIKKEANEAKGK
jgi:hypothetical protein